jgi:DNA-binding NtrC family response regulator
MAPSRWPLLFRRSAEPLFLLARRRILHVNQAWTALIGLPAEYARGKACRRYYRAEPGSLLSLLSVFSPPAEVLHGRPARVRRVVVSANNTRCLCDIDFISFHDARGKLRILGKITPLREEGISPGPLPEKLALLRVDAAQRYRLDYLGSNLPALDRVAAQVRLASQTRAPVLIVGEAGTGKDWLARAIHFQGGGQGFAALDCARLPGAVLAEVLFGGGLGARTSSGTIYLKEPAALPRDVQAQLCDWVAAGEVNRPRLIAGTSADLAAEVEAGRLLEELHCGLSTMVITLPPLRERKADLPQLVERLLSRACTDSERSLTGLTLDAWEFLRDHRWPGNLRELFALLRGAAERAKGEQIDTGDLPASLRRAVVLEQTPGRPPDRTLPLKDLLESVERRLLTLALRMTRGNKSQAAELLAIWRPLLIRRMKALGIRDDEY